MMINKGIQSLNKNLKFFWISTNNWIEPYIVGLNIHLRNRAFFIGCIELIDVRQDD